MKIRGKTGESFNFFRFISDAFLFSACLLMLFSTLEPFLIVNYVWRRYSFEPYIKLYADRYWSYKALLVPNHYVYFGSYWFKYVYPNDFSNLLVGMFVLQISAFIVGLICLFKIRWARIISFVLSLFVIVLMTDLVMRIDTSNFLIDIDYGLGYWLAYPSMLLFLFSFIMILYIKRRNVNIHYTPTHIHTYIHNNVLQ